MTAGVLVLPLAALLCAGCTHDQLRYDSLRQAQVASQFQQQQVLDNLAQFVANPNAIPYFTVINAGQAQVNDTGSASLSPNWAPGKYTTLGGAFTGSRTNQENFNFSPITDPYKLTWMRCAYQAAVGRTTDPVQLATANAVLQAWTGIGSAGCPGAPFEGCDETPCHLEPPCGALLPGPGWYCVGTKHDVPKDACLVGHYGKVYVWIPASGTDEFARLAMAIIGFSTANRSVTWNKTWACSDGHPVAVAAPGDKEARPADPRLAAGTPQGCTVTVTTTVGSGTSAPSGAGGGGPTAKGPGSFSSPNMAPPVVPITPSTFFVP
jgi:hypothetical protein